MSSLTLSAYERAEWRSRDAEPRRMRQRRYPTMAVEPAIIIAIGEYLDVTESRLDFRRDQAREVAP